MRKNLPKYVRNFLATWNKYKTHNGFRGLVQQDLTRNPYQSQPYTWVWYAGMGEADFTDLHPDHVKAVGYLLKHKLLVCGETYRRPLINNGEQVTTQLTATPGLLD